MWAMSQLCELCGLCHTLTDQIGDGEYDFTHLKYNPAATVRKGQQITTKRN